MKENQLHNNRPNLFALTVVLILMVGGTSSNSAYAQQEYEPAPVFDVQQVLSPEFATGPGYKVVDKVDANGMLYSFSVWSQYGWYRPQSMDMLKIRIAEINALNALVQLQKDPLFLEGVSDQVSGTLEATGKAITQPISTLRNIPLGLHKFGKNLAERGSQPTPSGQREIHQKAKLELARQLGVDPYTDNQQLQENLYTVAAHKNRGQLAVRIGTIFVPGGVGLAVTGAQINKGLQNRLYTMTPSELKQVNETNLASAGCDARQIGEFMNNPGYSITQKTVIAQTMADMKDVNGIHQYLDTIKYVPGPEVALFYQRRLQLAHEFSQTTRPLVEMKDLNNTPVFFDSQGKMVATVSIDYIYWNPEVAQKLSDLIKGTGSASVELRITGTASKIAQEKLREYGVTLLKNPE